MILITGATGTVGRRTTRILLREGHRVRLLVRDASRLPEPGTTAEVAVGDFDDEASLSRAMTGVRAVLVVTGDPTRPEQDVHMVRAARRADVRHLVKLSALAVTDGQAQDLVTRWQRTAEDCVRASGLDWTLLRPRAFMTNTLSWAPDVKATGTVRHWPGDAPSASVDPADVAAVAARALTEPGHAGQAYALTGPEALTAREQTRILARAVGRPLLFVERSREETSRSLHRRFGAPVAQALLESAERQLSGAKCQVEDTVERILGRTASDYAAWADRHAGAFR
ncbi:NAD(P)H-binding protein [Streptomyces sp. TP-A0356]|uniref:NAD(P)H-binding protein n=1 Tax=Streptomyces sp. TP-A0356 TaxID=1359208 RepID=UPI0006E1FC91|nr:NAD(P)H-binding protein [Streptomyces sp. TP-A0356]